MDVLKKSTYRVRTRYKSNSIERALLIEAESMEETLEVC